MARRGADEEAAASVAAPNDGGDRAHQHGAGRRTSASKVPEVLLSEEELERVMADFAKQDDIATETLSRQIVEKYLVKRKFYNPQRDSTDPNKPDLTKAWAYYEHVTLARRFVTDQTAENTFERAEPGETADTELFSWWKTPESALNEWGVGVGAYFSSVRIMSLILLVAGLISLPNVLYYRSEAYNGPGGQSNLGFLLQGTTICTNREWVECQEGCERSSYRIGSSQDRWAEGLDGTTYVQRTLCVGAEMAQGMWNYGALLFMTMSVILLSWYQRKREIRFDEDKSTSTDYSIKICNPPPDAYDPDKWRDFFEQFSEKQVTVVTVAVNNEDLLFALVMRRIFRNKLRQLLPQGTDLDNAAEVSREVDAHIVLRESRERGCFEKLFACLVVPILRLPPFHMFHDAETLLSKIDHWTKKAKELQKNHYDVTNVFVTFETEEGQRSALAALRVGALDLARQNTSAMAPTALFQGRVLKVVVPAEPNAIRWQQMTISTARKYLQRLVTFVITLGLIGLSGFVINRARTLNSLFFSICVSTFNFIIPFVIKLLLLLERHSNEGSRQKSMYMKITLFRWSNSAILTKLITPFMNTLGDDRLDLIKSINGVLIAEMVVSPLLRLCDMMGLFRKHVMAPRAPTQELMNLNFTGTIYNLAERFTDFTKVIFLILFYSALNPNAWFIGFATLIIQYYTDKFCLMRLWTSSAYIGNELAVFNRRYFLSGALLAFAIVSSYAYAEFPYDNLCDANDGSGGEGFGRSAVPVQFWNGTVGEIDVPGTHSPAIFCQQNYIKLPGFDFPALPSAQNKSSGEWMSDSQALLVTIFGWTSLAALVIFVIVVFGNAIINAVRSIFSGEVKEHVVDQKIDFSAVHEIFGYIPSVKAAGFLFPFLATDVDDVDSDLIGWHDPHRSYDEWNLIYDVPYEGMRRTRRRHDRDQGSPTAPPVSSPQSVPKHPIFSLVKHYPPEWAKKKSKSTKSG